VVFRSIPDKEFPGSVARLGREVDRETREFVVDVHVVELPENWAVGQRAEVFIETGRKSGVVVISEDQLAWQGGQPGAFVETDGKARWRPVTLGMRGGGRVEISSGLKAGDRVLTPADPKKPLADGKRVNFP
jgi:multidrug efflux pump subunit AcrA (membrane-fusion protein)